MKPHNPLKKLVNSIMFSYQISSPLCVIQNVRAQGWWSFTVIHVQRDKSFPVSFTMAPSPSTSELWFDLQEASLPLESGLLGSALISFCRIGGVIQ